MRTKLIGAAVIALSLVGCADSVAPYPEPPVVSVPPTSSSIPDYSNVSIPAVGGTTTTAAPAIQNGQATLSGTVKLGGAPVGGATVQLDRFVGESSTTLSITTNENGVYRAANIQGGRYRVRAFRPPNATSTAPKTFFMASTEQKSLDLDLANFGGDQRVSFAIAPSPPVVGELFNFAVSITASAVDSGGIARSTGVGNIPLRLDTDGGRALLTPNVVSTNGSGTATWQMRCDAIQNQGLTVTFADGSTQRPSVAACQPPAPTTTTTATTAAPAAATTTTVRR